jgi:hypothetical protein
LIDICGDLFRYETDETVDGVVLHPEAGDVQFADEEFGENNVAKTDQQNHG